MNSFALYKLTMVAPPHRKECNRVDFVSMFCVSSITLHPLPSSLPPPPPIPSLQGTMIGGVFVYNHKGEVLISRVYRDNVT